jgi:acetamidase/formamidase
VKFATAAFTMLLLSACGRADDAVDPGAPLADFTIPGGKEHYAFSRAIPPVLRVPNGAVIEVHTKDASDNPSWGWTDTHPDYAYLGKELDEIHLKTYTFTGDRSYARFSDGISVPLRPFPGVMGVPTRTKCCPRFRRGLMAEIWTIRTS